LLAPQIFEFFRTRILPFFRRSLHGNLTLTVMNMGYLSGFKEQSAFSHREGFMDNPGSRVACTTVCRQKLPVAQNV
jgi:hypothetical protein